MNSVVQRQMPLLLGSVGGALALVMGGTALVSGRVRPQSPGRGPALMTLGSEHHDPLPHGGGGGGLIIGGGGRVVRGQEGGQGLVKLAPGAEQRPGTRLGFG
ncbi:hypothetical protein ACM01_46850, partial [Streptomyces viridochromogenes]